MKQEKIYVNWREFGQLCENLLLNIRKKNKKYDNIYGIPRGGLPVAVYLSHHLEIPLIHNFKKMTDNTLIVDEIADTGETLKNFNPENIAVIFKNKRCCFKPKYWEVLVHDWVVFPWELHDK